VTDVSRFWRGWHGACQLCSHLIGTLGPDLDDSLRFPFLVLWFRREWVVVPGTGIDAIASRYLRRPGVTEMVDRWLVETDLNEELDFYTRANVGEVFPDPVAPLSFFYLQNENGLGASELGFRRAYVRLGAFDPDEYPENECLFLGVAGGYCYLNASAMRLMGHRAPGMTPDDVDASFFGDAPGVPEFVVKAGFDRPDLTEKMGETFQWIFTTPDLPDVMAHQQLVNRLRAERPNLAEMTDRQLIDHALGVADEHFADLFAEHIYISMCATVPMGTIAGVCEAVGRPADTLKLIVGLGDVESAAPSLAMWELGRLVADSDTLAAIFDAGIDGLDDRLRHSSETDATEFVEAFDDFVYRHGSRGPNEWETRCPTWETDHDLALAAIDRMRLADEDRSPFGHDEERAIERKRLGEEIAGLLADDPETQGQFVAALNAATVFVPGRERTKTNCVKLVEELRMPFHEFGRRRVDAGHFHKIDDFGLLTRTELRDEVDHPGKYSDVLQEREDLYLHVAALQEPFLFQGRPPEMSGYPRRDATIPEPLGAGATLTGVPGCPGVERGVARVVTDPHDPTALRPGDVLVAPFTDPSWTPLFVPAAAVVVDVGAPLSHAIIVSRELGIPCVVSATDATKRIPDGATVEVDGTTGTVTVIGVEVDGTTGTVTENASRRGVDS
jgi:pyruvate,water dikinase